MDEGAQQRGDLGGMCELNTGSMFARKRGQESSGWVHRGGACLFDADAAVVLRIKHAKAELHSGVNP